MRRSSGQVDRVYFRAAAAVAFLAASLYGAMAAERIRHEQSLYLFSGALLTGTFPGWTNVPFAGGIEGNYLVGAAYDRRLFDLGKGFDVGYEVGLAGRFGDGSASSAEFWGGASFRYKGWRIGKLQITPRLVIGLSAVTGTIGIEKKREADRGGNATLLGYMGPELDFKLPDRWPNVELVFRTHHRSGLFGTIGGMFEGANATTVGLRFDF
jgi:hypothetical protein